MVTAFIVNDAFWGAGVLSGDAGDRSDDLEAFVASTVGRSKDLSDRLGRQDPGYGGELRAGDGSWRVFWRGDGSPAGDAPDCFYRFRREAAGDPGGHAAHHAELAFGMVQTVSPLVDVGVDDSPGQRFGLL
jgi:hypothetical protein